MKVIFLDVDGVLLPIGSKDKKIPEEKIILLKKLVEETNSRIVLSSTWRLNANRENYEDVDYENLVKILNKYGLEIYDRTPAKQIKTVKNKIITKNGMTIVNYVIDRYSTRGAEISEWLENKSTESFVILDDQNFYYEFFSLEDNFVQIKDPYIGLQEIDIEKAKSILNIKRKIRIK